MASHGQYSKLISYTSMCIIFFSQQMFVVKTMVSDNEYFDS